MRATRRQQKWAVQVATFVRLPSCWFCSPVSGFFSAFFWGPPTTSSYELVQLSFKAKLRIMYYNILCRGCCPPLTSVNQHQCQCQNPWSIHHTFCGQLKDKEAHTPTQTVDCAEWVLRGREDATTANSIWLIYGQNKYGLRKMRWRRSKTLHKYAEKKHLEGREKKAAGCNHKLWVNPLLSLA